MASSYHLTAVVFLMCCSTTTFAQENSTFEPGNNTFVGTTLNPTTTFAQENSTFQPGNNSFVGTTLNPTTTFAQESTTFQPGNNTFVGCKINIKANKSNGCNLQVDKSKIQEVLSKHDNSTTTNIVKIKVSVSGNRTGCFPEIEWPWASEIGRTIISLVRRGKDAIFTSPLFTSLLEVGTEEVDIQVMEKTDGCLPLGDEGSDMIFEFVLRQLSHSEDKHVFKLCRAHNDEYTRYITYNCCRIVGDRNLTVCADYSSVVVNFALPTVIVVFLISLLMVLPFVLEHIITCPTIKSYKTSDSHMSLISIVSLMFFEDSNPAMSFFRRCVFAGLSLLVYLPDFFGCLWLKIVFGVWAGVFALSYPVPMTHTECENKCTRAQWDKNIILCFTLPFSLYYTFLEEECNKDLNSCPEGLSRQDALKWLYNICICILTILYFIICVPLLVIIFLVKFTLVDALIYFVCPQCCCGSCGTKLVKFGLFVPLRCATLLNIAFFTGMIFSFALSTVVGLILNAEYFNPFIAPILTVVAYFWKNWKISVEVKCLELKTSIIEVCKEKAPPKEDENISENRSTNINAKNNNELTCKDRLLDFLCSCIRDTSNDSHTWRSLKNPCLCCTGNTDNSPATNNRQNTNNRQMPPDNPSRQENMTRQGKYAYAIEDDDSKEGKSTAANEDTGSVKPSKEESKPSPTKDQTFIIEFDEHGEAMIPKELYEKISKTFIPLEHLLFYFFRRLIFVGLYAFVMFTVMILARDSGVSESVQLISAIAAALIPFIFDTIFADHHLSQRTSKSMATKERLEHILKVKRENNTIVVEVSNLSQKDKEIKQPRTVEKGPLVEQSEPV